MPLLSWTQHSIFTVFLIRSPSCGMFLVSRKHNWESIKIYLSYNFTAVHSLTNSHHFISTELTSNRRSMRLWTWTGRNVHRSTSSQALTETTKVYPPRLPYCQVLSRKTIGLSLFMDWRTLSLLQKGLFIFHFLNWSLIFFDFFNLLGQESRSKSTFFSRTTRMLFDAISSMTWNGLQGFQMPIANDSFLVDGVGALGTTHTERGLTYYEVELSGHMYVI